ncbi:MAG: hypothetical protein JJE07_04850 [Flavobacteriaceae bacterium]|nr:hypothetical protein [Flavobacteriaceae bacterium]
MSKKDLKKYLRSLEKDRLEEQILELYDKFDNVRTFYNFVFDPKEDKLIGEAKFRISKEYFPQKHRKAKARRSVAQNQIRHFLQLGVDPNLIADVMLFNIEIAQTFSSDKHNITEAFSKSMFRSFEQAVNYIHQNELTSEFINRIYKIKDEAEEQKWPNLYQFEKLTGQFD